MPRIHYKSDFDFILTLLDKDGHPIGFPPCDFTVTLASGSSARRFTASCIGGHCTNLFNDDGQIHIVADSHGLAPGHLRATVELTAPDTLFPDGSRRLIHPAPLDIDLILGPSDIPTDLTASLRLPLLKGAPFTYADFTLEQLAALRLPAEEAATECRTSTTEAVTEMQSAATAAIADLTAKSTAALSNIATTTTAIEEAEAHREASEAVRMNTEAARTEAEANRATAEQHRTETETIRTSAETARQEAELRRASSEALRAQAEAARIDAESARQEAEAQRVASESARVQAEHARTAAENSRHTAETARIAAEAQRAADTDTRLAEIDRLTANNGALLRGEKGEKGENAAPIVLSQQEYDALTSEQRRGNIYYIW